MEQGAENTRENGVIAARKRATALFANFFLIILAYYYVKPASRSLFVEYLGADQLPYVWIGTAIFLGGFIGAYNRLVKRFRRLTVVLGTCLVFTLVLALFSRLLYLQSAPVAVAFYIFVDIFSVVLVEQCWSLANTVFDTREGKRWYGVIGTGGLVGGALGGTMSSIMLTHTAMQTQDLLLVAAAILAIIAVLNLAMGRLGIYQEAPTPQPPVIVEGKWRNLIRHPYLVLIAGILLLAQLAQPVVEYQFMKIVETAYTELDSRTAYLSFFFAVMGLISIAINLTITPLIHRYLGVIAGLLFQPVMLAVSTLAFFFQPTLFMASVMKVSDRGLSYSINRASRELLYVPIDPVHTYQLKAWIDMFGYRLFKVLGSVLILAVTQWSPIGASVAQVGLLTLACCGVWFYTLSRLRGEYNNVMRRPVVA